MGVFAWNDSIHISFPQPIEFHSRIRNIYLILQHITYDLESTRVAILLKNPCLA
jgi:hypothetical protein